MQAVLERLSAVFRAAGKQLYLVGGCVRDELLGRPLTDLDLTTDALPAETRALLEEAGASAIYGVGEKFGTVGARFDGLDVEITTFRSEWYEPGSRKPAVEFGSSLEADLARRDFTINAMARDLATGAVIDPFGGRDDLRRRLVRAVGVPEERFAEDPLRLLRAVRFATQLGFTIEPRTAQAIAAQADALATVSRERIAEEFQRILTSPRPSRGVRLLCQLGLMRHIVPELLDLQKTRADSRYRHKDVFEHTMQVLDKPFLPPERPIRWAALLHDIAKPRTMSVENGEVRFHGHEVVGEKMARAILGRLRLDRDTIERVARLVLMHQRINSYEGDWTDGAVRRFMREAGDALDDLFLLSLADVTSQRPHKVQAAERRVRELQARCAELRAREDIARLRSPLDGHELMAMFGRPPGPWIKPIKEYLLGLVLDGELAQDDKERAAELARAWVREHEGTMEAGQSERTATGEGQVARAREEAGRPEEVDVRR